MLLMYTTLKPIFPVSPSPWAPVASICQDVLLPYMTNPRHASDTLFFLAEEDWRLYEDDQLPQEQLFEASMEEAAVSLSRSPGHGGSSSSQPTAADEQRFLHREAVRLAWERRSSTDAEQNGPRWLKRSTKPARHEFLNPSQHLQDLVRLCTAAHRVQRGNLVWLCWDGDTGPNQPMNVSHGSMFLAVSKSGAD